MLAARVQTAFDLFGYRGVVVPAFEHAAVLERGLGPLDADEVLRFVEPETGEVVALRPDLTPQIARLVVTRLLEEPGPQRLAYHGSVWRRRRARARRHQQIPQAGIELVGLAAEAGDLEVVRVGAAALRAAGLERFVIDVGHAAVAGSLLSGLPPLARAPLVEALALKDRSALVRRAEASGLRGIELAGLAELADLHGGAEVWSRAERALGGTSAMAAVTELRELWERLGATETGVELSVDLGETSRFEYYSGMTCQFLAEGPGEAIGAGGRYDGLFGRFGAPRPAAGIALDLDNLAWALARHEAVTEGHRSVVVVGPVVLAEAVAEALRARRVPCVVHLTAEPEGYARAWQHSHVLHLEASRPPRWIDLERGAEVAFETADAVALAIRVAGLLQTQEAEQGLR